MSDIEVSAPSDVVEEAAPAGPSFPPSLSPVYVSNRRFYKSPAWKHLITRRDSTVVTDLTRLASSRTIQMELGAPSSVSGFVPSDDFRVYFPTDDEFAVSDELDSFWEAALPFRNYPRLAEGVRLMYSFRRDGEGPGGAPWSIRHAGPVLELNDEADPDRRMSKFTAYDPWQYLYQRPARLAEPITNLPKPALGSIPGEKGVVFPAGTRGDEIVCELLKRSIDEDGLTYIDAGLAFGGTADYAGTIEETIEFLDPIVFARGMSVGEAWDQMVDTGTLDIVLTPIFDPLNRPGYCAELSIYNHAGTPIADDPFSTILVGPSFRWDRTGRALIRIERGQDGRERANRIRAYNGGTGAANAPWTEHLGFLGAGTEDIESTWDDSDSATRYGESWFQQTYVRQSRKDLVGEQALDDLRRRRQGLRTWSLYPTPEFSPRPFQDYMPGSFVGFYHSQKLREEQWWLPYAVGDTQMFPRILGFTISLSDDSLETVTQLDITLDDVPVNP